MDLTLSHNPPANFDLIPPMAAVIYDVVPTLPLVKAHLIVDCVLVFLTWVAVGLRVTARKISGVGLGWDDYLILAALVRFPVPLAYILEYY